MAIRTKEFCDICERTLGENHPDAEIKTIEGRPCFPQLIWTFFRSGYRCVKDAATGVPALEDHYFGKANRLEFCQKHGTEMNVLLKAYSLGDSRINKILDKLITEDLRDWDEKRNKVAEEQFEIALEMHMDSKTYQKMKQEKENGNRDGEHAESSDNNGDGGGDHDKTRVSPDSE